MTDTSHTIELGTDLLDTLTSLRALIAAGRGDERMQLKARHGDEPEPSDMDGFEGSIREVYAKLVDTAKDDPVVTKHIRRLEDANNALFADGGVGKGPAVTNKIGREPETQIRLKSMKQELQSIVGSIPQALEKLLNEMAPELMAKFYPRIYESTGRYHSPKQCVAYLVNSIVESNRLGYDRTPTAYRMMMPALEPMARRGMPLFFIAPDLLEAIQRTDFADDINWTELPLPYEEGIFILPKGAFVHPEDGEVSMLLWARFSPGEYPMPFVPGKPVVTIASQSMILLALCPENAIWYDSALSATNRPVIRLHNLFYREPGEPMPAARKSSFMDQDLTEKDEGFLEKMGTIMFGTFLAMNAKPELLERGKLLRRVAKAGKVREFWSPNIIGPRYKLKREVPRIVDRKFETGAPRPTGTHASPRMHWRRGHFRNQPYGPKRQERKAIWIEPCLIGAEA